MRSKKEIDEEYTGFAMLYGDKLFKMKLWQKDIDELFQKLATLNQEAAQAAASPLNAEPPMNVNEIPVMGAEPAQDEHEIQ